jgi:hypothetical protein
VEPKDASQAGSSLRMVGGIEIPHSALAREACETAAILLPDVLNGHAHRVFVFAALTGRRQPPAFDAELLYVAAMFINVGLNAAYCHSQRRYEVESADAVRQFLASHQVADSMALEVWYAVALHTTHGIPDYASPLAASLAAGVHTDLFGDKAAAVSRESQTEILRAYPRGERFKEQFH